jgi:FtsP/CotA-like multicopper oxidase with cupredoxin domain
MFLNVLTELEDMHRRLHYRSEGNKKYSNGVCGLGNLKASASSIREAYLDIKDDFNQIIDDATPFERSNIFGVCLRLAFHDAGELDLRTNDDFGPDGCLSNTGANAGLIEADSLVNTLLEELWQKNCDDISRADFWALMGKLAAERADPSRTLNIPFHWGRKDNQRCDGGAGRLPEHQPGMSEFRRVFVDQMKMTIYDGVTLLGAHSVGHVHTEHSGFGTDHTPEHLATHIADNAWDETPDVFDNQYYKSLIQEPWLNTQGAGRLNMKNTWHIPKKLPDGIDNGEPAEQADGVDPLDVHPETIMLNADMAIAFPIHTDLDPVTGTNLGVIGELCGKEILHDHSYGCTSSTAGDVPGWPFETYDQALKYTQDNRVFLRDFEAAYMRMVTAGYRISGGPIKDGKLGTLKPINLGPYFEPLPATVTPYGVPKDICPTADGQVKQVLDWPSSPFKITPFQDDFKNPDAAVPTNTVCRADGHCIKSFEYDVIDVQARPFDNAVPGCQAKDPTWFLSYGAHLPGPTITMPAGHESIVRFNNKINPNGHFKGDFHPCVGTRSGRPFSVHYHGSASLAPYDGWADDETCAGETKDYVYPNNRPNSGWYHDHALHVTADNAYSGLAGFYIVSAKKKHGGCGEPYNLEDIEEKIMILGDKLLDNTCQLRMEPKGVHERSFYGDINVVNGVPFPVMRLEPKYYRFRVLDSSVSRPYLLKIKTEGGVDVSKDVCHIIASDGGYAPAAVPFPDTGLLIGVAERYEFVCDFRGFRGKTLYFWNENDGDQMKDVPMFCFSHLISKITVSTSTSTPNPPVFDATKTPDASLTPITQALTPSDIATATAMAERGEYHRRMDFGRGNGHWVINGETWSTFKIAADDVGQNTWELWLFRTGGGWFHPIHMHLVDFFVLKRDGANGVRSWERNIGKDVFYLGPSNNVWVLARFGAHKGDYMFHCHNLIHEDNDMLRAFHMVGSEQGKTANTAARFIANPVNHIIYGNYQYADPMFGDTAAKPTVTVPVLNQAFTQQTLDKNLYRIFYPLAADFTLMPQGYDNPWRSKVCPLTL